MHPKRQWLRCTEPGDATQSCVYPEYGADAIPPIVTRALSRSSASSVGTSPKPFGWGKTIGGLARPMLCGAKKARVQIHSDYGQLQSHPNTKAHCGRGLRSPAVKASGRY
jgi:hypothetical protein